MSAASVIDGMIARHTTHLIEADDAANLAAVLNCADEGVDSRHFFLLHLAYHAYSRACIAMLESRLDWTHKDCIVGQHGVTTVHLLVTHCRDFAFLSRKMRALTPYLRTATDRGFMPISFACMYSNWVAVNALIGHDAAAVRGVHVDGNARSQVDARLAAHAQCRAAADVVRGIVLFRLRGGNRDMAALMCEHVLDTRCFDDWMEIL